MLFQTLSLILQIDFEIAARESSGVIEIIEVSASFLLFLFYNFLFIDFEFNLFCIFENFSTFEIRKIMKALHRVKMVNR